MNYPKKPSRVELVRDIVSLFGLSRGTKTLGYLTRVQLLELRTRLTKPTTRSIKKGSTNGVTTGAHVR